MSGLSMGLIPDSLPEVEPSLDRVRFYQWAGVGEIHHSIHGGVMARPPRPGVAVRIAGLTECHPIGACQLGGCLVGRSYLVTHERGWKVECIWDLITMHGPDHRR